MTYITDLAKGDPNDIQINSSGKLDGDNNLTWDGSTLKSNTNIRVGNSLLLEDPANNTKTVTIQAPDMSGHSSYSFILPKDEGTANQILSTGVTPGELTWVDQSTGAPPQGSDYSIQFNGGGGNFGGSDDLIWDNSISILEQKSNVSEINNNKGDSIVSTSTGTPYDIKIVGNTLFVVYLGGTKDLISYDISDPNNIIEIGKLTDVSGNSLDIKGNYAYISGNGIDLTVVNIENPSSMVLITTLDSSGMVSKMVKISGNYAYTSYTNDNVVKIIDISNPISPFIVNDISDTNSRLNNAHNLFINGSYLYVTGSGVISGNTNLSIVDISDPKSATVIGFYDGTTNSNSAIEIYNVFVEKDVAYLTGFNSNSVCLLDVSNPNAPTFISKITSTTDTELTNPFALIKQGDFIFVSTTPTGRILKYDISSGTPVKMVSSSTGLGYIRSFAISGNHLYTASNSPKNIYSFHLGGLEAYSISSKSMKVDSLHINNLNTENNIIVKKSLFAGENISIGNDIQINSSHFSIKDTSKFNLSSTISSGLDGIQNMVSRENYLYIASGTGMSIVDVSDIENPVIVNNSLSFTSIAFDIKLSGNYAFVTGVSGTDLTVIDITNPYNISEVSSYNDTGGASYYYLEIYGGFLYATRFTETQVDIIDISDPTDIKLINTFNTQGDNTGIKIRDGIMYLVTAYINPDDKIMAYSLEDPLVPTFLGSYTDSGFQLCQSIEIKGDYAYIACREGDKFIIVNISDPTNMTKVSTGLDLSTIGNGYSLAISGDYVYLANFSEWGVNDGSILKLDVSVPTNVKIVDKIQDSKYNLATQFDANASIYVGEGFVSVALRTQGGLELYKTNYSKFTELRSDNFLTDKMTVNKESRFRANAFFDSGLTVAGNLNFGGTLTGDIQIPSSTDLIVNSLNSKKIVNKQGGLSDMFFIGNYSSLNNPKKIVLHTNGSIAYVACNGNDRVFVMDVSNPNNPELITSRFRSTPNTLEGITDVFISGNYLYCVGENSVYLQVFDITNPIDPKFPISGNSTTTGTGDGELVLTGVSTGLDCESVIVEGNYAYISCKDSKQLIIVDVSDPTTPVNVSGGQVTITGTGYGLDKSGNFVYVTCDSSTPGVSVVDVSVVTSPSVVNTITTSPITEPRGISISGNYAFVTDKSNHFIVIDITTPASADVVGSIQNDPINLGSATGITINGTTAYVASESSKSLTKINISTPTSPSISETLTDEQFGNAVSVVVTSYYAYIVATTSNTINTISLSDITPSLILESSFIKDVETSELRLKGLYSSETITLKAGENVTTQILTFPSSIGTSNQLLSVGSTPGTMEWVDPSSGVTPGGTATGAIQYNNGSGGLDAEDTFLWTAGSNTLQLSTDDSGIITGLATPSNSNEAASKGYVDSIAGQGVSWKNPVLRASTVADGNFSLSGQADSKTIDGLALSNFSSGDRFLLKNQTSNAGNAIYELVVPGTGGAGFVDFVLPDHINGAKASGTAVFVEEGTDNDNQGFVVSDVTGTDTFDGATDVTWVKFTTSAVTASGPSNAIQFTTDGSTFSGSSDLTWNNATSEFSAGNVTIDGTGFSSSSPTFTINKFSGSSSNLRLGMPTATSGSNITIWPAGQGGAQLVTFRGDGMSWFYDDKTLGFGTDQDMQIKHDGSNSSIINATGGLTLSTTDTSVNSDIEMSTVRGSIKLTAGRTVSGGGNIDMKIGDNANSTRFDFQDSAGLSILRLASAGESLIGYGTTGNDLTTNTMKFCGNGGTIVGTENPATTSTNGRFMKIKGGNAISGTGVGGRLEFISGNGFATGDGGVITILAGNGGSNDTSVGGDINITSGTSTATNGDGGDINITSGIKTGTGVGGKIKIKHNSTDGSSSTQFLNSNDLAILEVGGYNLNAGKIVNLVPGGQLSFGNAFEGYGDFRITSTVNGTTGLYHLGTSSDLKVFLGSTSGSSNFSVADSGGNIKMEIGSSGGVNIYSQGDTNNGYFKFHSTNNGRTINTELLSIDALTTTTGLASFKTGIDINLMDNVDLRIGTGNDFTLVHDGTNSSITNVTGNLTIENTPDDKNVIVKLGETAGATKFSITNSTNKEVMSVNSTGNVNLISDAIEYSTFGTLTSTTKRCKIYGDYLYVLGGSNSDGFMKVYSIMSHIDPELADEIVTGIEGAYDFVVFNNTLFVARNVSGSGLHVSIIDITQKDNITLITTVDFGSTGENVITSATNSGIELYKNYIFIGSTVSLYLIKINSTTALEYIGTQAIPSKLIESKQNNLYCVTSSLASYDISNVESIGSYTQKAIASLGASANSFKIRGNYAALVRTDTVQLYDITSESTITLMAGIGGGAINGNYGIGVIGDLVYTLNNSTMYSVKLSESGTGFSSQGSTSFSGTYSNYRDIEIRGKYGYLVMASSTAGQGIVVFDTNSLNLVGASIGELSSSNVRVSGDIDVSDKSYLNDVYARGALSVSGSVYTESDLRIGDSDGSHYVSIKAADTTTQSQTLTLPPALGTSGAVLTDTAGDGVLNWTVPSAGVTPGGTAPGAIQYNNGSGGLDAENTFLWTAGTNTLQLSTDDSGIITGLATPSNSNEAASKGYVDSIAGQGVSWKNPVLRASTVADGNFSLSGQADSKTIDGLALSNFSSGDRFLLKNQTSNAGNAIYELVVPGTGGAGFVDFVLPEDINGTKASGTAVFVEEGTDNDNQGFVVSDVTGTDTFDGATDVTWVKFTHSAVTASGPSNAIQFTTDGATFSGSADLTWDGTDLRMTDNKEIKLGNDAGLRFWRAGATTNLNNTGNINIQNSGSTLINNTSASGTVELRLGGNSQNGSSKFLFRDGGAKEIMEINDVGQIDMNSNGENATKGYLRYNAVNNAKVKTQLLSIDSLTATTGLASFKTGIDINLMDDVELRIGTGNDLTIVHNGTNSSVTNATGNLTIGNTDIDDDIIIKLGSDTAATKTIFQNNSGTSLMEIDGAGAISVGYGGDFKVRTDKHVRLGNGGEFAMIYTASTGTTFTAISGDYNSLVLAGDYEVKLNNSAKDISFKLGTAAAAQGGFRIENSTNTKSFVFSGDGKIVNSDTIQTNEGIIFQDSGAGTNTVTLQAGDGSTAVTSHTLTLPPALGTAGSVLTDTAGDGVLSWAEAAGGGSGDVVGPSSSTDNAIARYDTTSGKLLQDSTITLSDTSTIANTTGTFTLDQTAVANFDFKLGTNTNSAHFDFKDSSNLSMVRLQGDGSLILGIGKSTGDLQLYDSVPIKVGTGSDLTIVHNGTNSSITNVTGNLTIENTSGDINLGNTSNTGTINVNTGISVNKGSVTQVTNVNTGVTVNTPSGKITTVSLAIPSHEFEIFTVTNSKCLSTSIVLCNIIDYDGNFTVSCSVKNITNGSFQIVLSNPSGGSLSDVAVIGFLII